MRTSSEYCAGAVVNAKQIELASNGRITGKTLEQHMIRVHSV